MPTNSTEKQQASLSERVINHIQAMADGSPDHDKVVLVLTQRAMEALGIAQHMAKECDKTERIDAEAKDHIALSALATWDPKPALTDLRHSITGYLGPECVPGWPLKAWLGRAKKDMAGLEGKDSPQTGLQPEDFDPDAPASNPAPTAPVQGLTQADMAEVDRDARELHMGEVATMDAYDVMQQVGRIQGIEFTRRVGDIAIAQTFIELRQSKKYKHILIQDENGKTRHVGSFDEFCRAKLGKSYNRCLELAQTLHLLGPALYEQAEVMGLTNKDYRIMRALPEANQEVVKQAIEAESKEQVVDLLQDLAAQNAAAKEALEKENADLQADLGARDKLLQARAEALEKRELELAKLKSLPPAENVRLKLAREKEAVAKIGPAEITAEAALNAFLGQVSDILQNEEISLHTKDYATDSVRMFCEKVIEFLAANYIDVNMVQLAGVVPGWEPETAKAEIVASTPGAEG